MKNRTELTAILLIGLLFATSFGTHAEEQLIVLEDTAASTDQSVSDDESSTELTRLNDSYSFSVQKITDGEIVSVEYPVLIPSKGADAYEYTDEVNQKFFEAADAEYTESGKDMIDMYNAILADGNTDLAAGISYETTVESVYLLGRAYSVMQNHYSYAGGAHPYSWVTGVTYDLTTGEEMTMGEILGCDESTAREAVVLAYWDHIIGQVENITEQSIRDSFDSMEYWFDEEGMRVSLAPYVVASYAAGPQDVLVTQDHVAQARG